MTTEEGAEQASHQEEQELRIISQSAQVVTELGMHADRVALSPCRGEKTGGTLSPRTAG